MEPEKPSFFSTRYIKFLGGRNTFFTFIIILLIGLIIMVYGKVSFIFDPLTIFLGNVILPVILAVIAYYLLRPILRLIEKIKIPRVWGILIIFLALIGLITLLVFLVVPFLKSQSTRLVEELPVYLIQLLNSLDSFLRTSFVADYYLQIEKDAMEMLRNVPTEVGKLFQSTITSVATGITSVVGAVTSFVLSIIMVPFILFYLLKDGEKLPRFVIRVFPPRMRDDFHSVFKSIDNQISAYIQGQILVSMCIGFMIFIGFTIIGMDYALLLGVIAMVTSVVPYLGPVIAITPAAIIALVSSTIYVSETCDCMDNCSVCRREIYLSTNYGEITSCASNHDYFRINYFWSIIWSSRCCARDSRVCNIESNCFSFLYFI